MAKPLESEELSARARRHFVEGAAIIAEFERSAGTIDEREQIAEAGRLLAAAYEQLRSYTLAHGHVVDLRSVERDAAERLDD